MDPLSDVLSLLKLRTSVYDGFHAGGAWCLEFSPHEGAKFHAAVSGECWLAVEGISEPFHVQAGDCLLLPRGRAFRVASDLTLPPTDPSELLSGANGGITLNGGGDFFSVSGYFHLVGNQASILLGLLPPVVHIRRDSDKDLLRWCLELLRQELQKPQPGGTLVAQHVASLLLLQVLRLYLAQANATDVGWLFALTDKQMSAALQAMHDDPARAWTLQSLATCVGMSRTAFALRFRDTVGTSVMTYLTRWRMLMAEDRLVTSNEPVAAIAESLGYNSESSFSTAFRRVVGVSPRQYGRSTRSNLPPDGTHTMS